MVFSSRLKKQQDNTMEKREVKETGMSAAEHLLAETKRKQLETVKIVELEKKLADVALANQSEVRKEVGRLKKRENDLDVMVRQAIELERRLEQEREEAHKQGKQNGTILTLAAVAHEQKRAEVCALRQAEELRLDNLIKEADKHRLAAEQAKAFGELAEMETQAAVIRKKIEVYENSNKVGILHPSNFLLGNITT